MMLPEAMLMIVVYAAFHAMMKSEIHVDVHGLCCWLKLWQYPWALPM